MGGQAPSVRRARSGDIDCLLALQREAFGEDPLCLTRAGLASLSRSRRHAVLVAEAGGSPLGYAVLRRRPFRSWASLDFLVVSAQNRRAGIGASLVAAVSPLARRRALRLLVRTDNHAAVAFYGRRGFAPAGLRSGYYADGCDALVMTRATS